MKTSIFNLLVNYPELRIYDDRRAKMSVDGVLYNGYIIAAGGSEKAVKTAVKRFENLRQITHKYLFLINSRAKV